MSEGMMNGSRLDGPRGCTSVFFAWLLMLACIVAMAALVYAR